MFIFLYDKFIQDNKYQILSESVGFCRRDDKTCWCFFRFAVYRVGQKSKPVLIYQYITSYVRKTLLFCIYTNSGTTASYIKLFALFAVLYSTILSSRYSDASVVY